MARLTRDEFAMLSRLLDAALDLSEDQRGAWLDSLPEPFDGAKALLRQMLSEEAAESRGEKPGFLNTLPQLELRDANPARGGVSFLEPGTVIGRYVLQREVGEGGMSTVWLARRTDTLTERLVAIKLPHLHLRNARLPERFERERDILARLSHPHIAHLYDAGVTNQGQPYLVMEFIEGEALLAYCTERHLGVDARLQLFLQILDAVAHAHRKGVIHRDIKPSNVLVRSGGDVVLLDFGIAKLLIEGEAGVSELTQHGGALLTLHYASPEQIAGNVLTPQTDVYSLGVLLYELLCEQRPHELGTWAASRGELERAIALTDPEAPSRRVMRAAGSVIGSASANARRELRGDLDAIVLKSLRKLPGDRYASCEAFAEDLQRHLRGDAVSARTGSNWYRLRRVAFRYRGAALAGFAIMSIALALTMTLRSTLNRPGVVPSLRADNRRSIAVLPFDNVSGEAANDFFTQGIQDEVLTHLGDIGGLKVMSRRATAAFDPRPGRLDAVKTALSIDDVLEGSVQRQGERVLVNVRLIETAGNTQLWAESFDRPVKDIFDVERDIAESVAAHLQAKLLPDERAIVARIDTQSAEAHTADLWGRFHMAKRDERSLRRAIQYFNEAIRLDSTYSMAYADLSSAYFYLANRLDEGDSTPFKRQARTAAERALSLSPHLAEAHTALAWVLLYFDWDVETAKRELEAAVRLAPNSLRARSSLANIYAVLGELDRAIAAMTEARTLDPLSAVISTSLANYTLGQERYDVAAGWCRSALELDQTAPYCHGILAIVALAGNDTAVAERESQQEPDDEWKDFTLTLVRQRSESSGTADVATQEFIARHEHFSPFLVAALYAFRNDADQSFSWLNRAYAVRDVGAIDFLQSPFFLRFRDDPRYWAFATTLGVARRMTD